MGRIGELRMRRAEVCGEFVQSVTPDKDTGRDVQHAIFSIEIMNGGAAAGRVTFAKDFLKIAVQNFNNSIIHDVFLSVVSAVNSARLARAGYAFDRRERFSLRESVSISRNALAARLGWRSRCVSMWNSRSGRRKSIRCRRPASRLGAAIEAEITAAPRPASAADRTASFDGYSRATRSAPAFRPNSMSASSKTDLVPDPRSRSTHLTSMRS